MGKKTIDVTIVGKGAYGALIAGKYARNDDVTLKAFVSRHAEGTKDKLTGAPIVRTAASWRKKFGRPRSRDVFDLCVHEPALLEALRAFTAIGARNFILPKPLALDRGRLVTLKRFIEAKRLNVMVASQWHYSRLVAELRGSVKRIGGKRMSRIAVSFSHSFGGGARDRGYTSVTAFLPHILEILHSAGLVQLNGFDPKLEACSPEGIVLRCARAGGKPEVEIKIDIASPSRAKTVDIFFDNNKNPDISAEFSGIFEFGTFFEYPAITIDGKITPIVEDVLETMVSKIVEAFGSGAFKPYKGLTTFKNYLPVAKKFADIAQNTERPVAIIGGGVFGTLIALQIAKNGRPVTVFEKSSDILIGASLVNQCRVHMGYHYPRDKQTARPLISAKEEFCKLFPDAIVEKNFNNYYCIAKEGSLTTKDDYLSFCRDLNLPFKEELPKDIKLRSDKIATSLKVPEPIFDVRHVRRSIHSLISKQKNIQLITSAEVLSIKDSGGMFEVSFSHLGEGKAWRFGAVVNATYSRINIVNGRAGMPLKKYQYELCEMPVVATPWKKPTGIAIMDGPFFGVMPFGFSKEYLLYDVEISVLERTISDTPEFKHNIAYYDDPKIRAERFKRYVQKMKAIIPEVSLCKYLYSLYTVRIVLPNREKTDARPTVIENPVPGYWQIFSGKIATSAPYSKELAASVDAFLKNGRKEPKSNR